MLNLINTSLRASVCFFCILFFSSSLIIGQQVYIQNYNAKTSASGATSHSLTSVPAGALLVVSTTSGGTTTNCTVSGGSLTWTKRPDASLTQSGNAEIHTAVFTAGGSITVTSNWGTRPQSSVCYVLTNQESTLNGVAHVANNQGAPSVSVTTSRANSILIVATSDWNAIDGNTRSYRGSEIERNYHRVGTGTSKYTGYNYYRTTSAVTSYTVGLTTPSTMKAGTAVLEIRPAPDTEPPSAITDLSSTGQTENSITLSWTAATDNVGVTGYQIYSGGNLIGSTTSTTYTVTDLMASMQYSFYIKAKDAANNSTNSNTTTVSTSGTSDLQTPSAITDLASTDQTASTITLSWTAATDNVGVIGYDIYKDGTYYTTTTNTSATVNGLSPSTEYNFSVRPKDAANNGNNSNIVTESTEAFTGVDYLNLSDGTEGVYNGNGAVTTAFGSTTIQNLQFTNPSGDNLVLQGCSNIVIENCYFGPSLGNAITLEDCSNITIQNCLFANNQTGVYAAICTGGIKVLNCQFINMHGPFPRGQAVQLNQCTGADYLIDGNRGENFFAESYPEDIINIFSSTGTSTSPITISNNIFRGGGPSHSGGGFVAGDFGSQYVVIDNNKIANGGQYGIAVAGGHYITVTDNQVYAIQKDWTNIGMFAWAQQGASCDHIEFSNNASNWVNSAGSPNDWWIAPPPEDCSGCNDCSAPTTGQTLASMAIPDPLITFVSEDELWKLRSDKTYQSSVVDQGEDRLAPDGSGGTVPDPIDLNRPDADAGSDQTISISTHTLDASGSDAVSTTFGTNLLVGYRWVQVSGPNTAIMSASTSSTNNLSGLSNGTYLFRIEVTQNNLQYGYDTYDADWVSLTVTSQSSATLNGSITLLGRPTPPNALWQIPLQVYFYANGNTTTPVYSYSVITDASGNFTITDLPPGTYTIGVKGSHTLMRVKEDEELVAGSNSVNFGTLLEGDVNNDNVVNLTDLGLLLSSYNKGPGDPGYLPNANLNGDGYVTGYDLGLLLNSYNTLGEYPQPDPPGRFFNPSVNSSENMQNEPKNNTKSNDQKIAYNLGQNYPNPFNKETAIQFTLPKTKKVNLSLYDISGRVVKVLVNSTKDAGIHTVNFNAGSFAKGIYYYRIQAGDFTDVKKLVIQ